MTKKKPTKKKSATQKTQTKATKQATKKSDFFGLIRSQSYLKRLEDLRKRPSPSKDCHVVILGAGMAGLVAAYELGTLGYRVSLLEAERHHLGGRVRTHRDPDSSAYGELGAMRIPTGHLLTRHYIDRMDLSLRTFVQKTDTTFAYLRHHRAQRSDQGLESLKSQYNLTETERSLSADDMWERGVVSVVQSLTDEERADLYQHTFTTARVREWDNLSLLEALQRTELSSEAIEYVSSVYGVETYLNSAFTEILREELEEIWIRGFDELVGGTDLLPRRLAEELKNTTLYQGARVHKIAQQEDSITAHYTDAENTPQQVTGDWLLCTIPLGVLSTLDLQDAVPGAAQWSIRRINYDSSTKVLIRCKKRFWEIHDGIFGGGSIWDGGIGHTWYPSDNLQAKDPTVSEAPAYLLASYTWGQHARRIDSMPRRELEDYVKAELQKLHPAMQESDVTQVIRWSWTEFHRSAGAFAFFYPGDQQTHYQTIKQRTGRLFFAGEHCSLAHSWIQGAIESAIDVAEKITQPIPTDSSDR